jgi:dUTPase
MLSYQVGNIDSGYRGFLIGAFRNLSPETHVVEKYQRLVQICSPDLKPFLVTLVDEAFLSSTERGAGGFGSTG